MQRHHVTGNYGTFAVATPKDLWSQAGAYPWPAVAAATSIVSDSASDAAAGTGAQLCTVTGLDANYKEISEQVVPNGVTPVNLVNQYLRINSFVVNTVGSGGVNAGNISVKQSTTTLGMIVASMGQMRQAIYTTSKRDQSFRLQKMFFDMLLNTTDIVIAQIWTRKAGASSFRLREEHRGVQYSSPLEAVIHLDAGEDVKMMITAFAATTPVTGGFDILSGSVAEFSIPR